MISDISVILIVGEENPVRCLDTFLCNAEVIRFDRIRDDRLMHAYYNSSNKAPAMSRHSVFRLRIIFSR